MMAERVSVIDASLRNYRGEVRLRREAVIGHEPEMVRSHPYLRPSPMTA